MTPGAPPMGAQIQTVNQSVVRVAVSQLQAVPGVPARTVVVPATFVPSADIIAQVGSLLIIGDVEDPNYVLVGHRVTVPISVLGQQFEQGGTARQLGTIPIGTEERRAEIPAITTGATIGGFAASTVPIAEERYSFVSSKVESQHVTIPEVSTSVDTPRQEVPTVRTPDVDRATLPGIPATVVPGQPLPDRPATTTLPGRPSVAVLDQRVPVNVAASCAEVPYITLVYVPDTGAPTSLTTERETRLLVGTGQC